MSTSSCSKSMSIACECCASLRVACLRRRLRSQHPGTRTRRRARPRRPARLLRARRATASAGARSMRATRACANGERRTAVCSIPGRTRSAVYTASPRARSRPSTRTAGSADDLARPGRPLLERVLFDDEPDLLVAALDLLLRADQSCHVRIASSIFGYAPQRQRLPAIACRISSVLGLGDASTSATALTI